MTDDQSIPSQRPRRLAAWTVSAASRGLPRGPVRDRYRQEFLAELYGMDSGRQMAHAMHIALALVPLRTAVRQNQLSTPEVLMTTTATRPLLCVLNLHHVWHLEHTEDGGRYVHCLRCGKDRSGGGSGSGDWAAGLGIGGGSGSGL